MRRLLAISVLSLATIPAALTLASARAEACSCIPTPGPVESAQKAGAVFHGKLLSVTDVPKTEKFELDTKSHAFEVIRTFKGNVDLEVRVISAASGAACGRNFGKVGGEWLLYARVDENGQLHDNLCSRTRPISEAAEDIAALEAAESLDAPPDEPNDTAAHDEPDPDPDPILPDQGVAGDEGGEGGPEPATPSKKGCSTTEGGGSGGLLVLLGLGLLARRRRRL